ncbi:BTAD domain-containing putative transcriptional regulator [Actinoplanes sp. HUAS TT8]|uniref:AfsR/SARP family transcriptional regulator n=1 Tax=Actinoplanes sp. HUAS TT8 TaxID=3447453 RepID=UPI003F51DEBA
MLNVRVLGSIEADIDGRPVDLGRPRQRALLGILVVARGEAVSTDRLVEELWRGKPPARAIASLQAYVSNLRRALEPDRASRGPSGVLVRRAAAYALCLPDDAVDAWRFERILAEARGRPADQARPLLTEALRSWRGPVHGEFRDEPWAIADAARLDELRLLAREQAIQAALRMRGDTGALVEAQQLVRDEPLRTEACRLLAITLWAAGREPDALAALRTHRETIRDELGLDPAPTLTALEQAVLHQREDLLDAELGPPAALRPAQLPLQLAAFTGRDGELDELTGLARASASTVLVAAITGMGGVGKTALAVRWAHQHRDDYPDGQLYVDLGGFAPAAEPLPVAEALHGFLTALGAPADGLPVTVPDRAALLRSMLAGRRMLLILDNARDADQVRDLIPAAAGCAVLVTSRVLLNDLVTTHHAHPIGLTAFGQADAARYLSQRIGPERTSAEPEATTAIITVCDGLPLALAVVAARVATNPSFTLASIARELRESEGLDGFAAPGVSRDPRTVISWSYRHLPDTAAALFRRLALNPGPDATIAAAAGLTGTSRSSVRSAMNLLVEAHLIREHQHGRFQFHDLLRAYAVELAAEHDTPAERDLVVRRGLDHYLHSALAATAVLHPFRNPIETAAAPAPGVTPEVPATADEALTWFDAEYPNLVAAITLAEHRNDGPYCWQLNWALAHYLQDLRRRLDDTRTLLQRALAMAEKAGNQRWIAYLGYALARCYYRLDRYDDSRVLFEQVITSSRASGDTFRLSQGLLGAAAATNRGLPTRENTEESFPYVLEALDLLPSLLPEDRPGSEATALAHLAWHAFYQPGGHEKAIAHLEASLAVLQLIGYTYGVANARLDLGHMHRRLGATDAALTSYRQALELASDVPEMQADALTGLAHCYHTLGDRPRFERSRRDALAILQSRHHRGTARIRASLDALGVPNP